MKKLALLRLSKNQLAVAYLVTCLIYLKFTFDWMGNLIIWMSIYLLGLPLLYMVLPLVGLKMFSLKSEKSIFLSFLASLTPLYYLLSAFDRFPFEVQTTAAGHTSQISLSLSLAIVFSAILFLGTSILSFRYCLKAYDDRFK